MSDEAEAKPVGSVWGTVPEGALGWQCSRRTGDTWERCRWYDPSQGLAALEWPVSTLSRDVIVSRWGSGEYRLQWMGRDPDGKSKGFGKSRAFLLDGVPRKPAYPNPPSQEAPAAVAPVVPPPADPSQLFSTVFGAVNGMMTKVLEFQSQQHARDLERMSAYHQQTLEMLRGASVREASEANNANVMRTMLGELRALRNRIDELEDGDDGDAVNAGEEGALVGAPQLPDRLLGMVAKLAEKYGPEVIEKIADDYLRR